MPTRVKKTATSSQKEGFGQLFVPELEYDEITKTYRHTYCGLEEVYEDKKRYIAFNPTKYTLFDGSMLEYLNDYPAYLGCIYEPGHRYYADCEAVRKNIAILRNALYLQLFPEGEFSFSGEKEEQAKQKILKEMGICLGATLKHEGRLRFFINLFDFSNRSAAEKRFGDFGMEHIGAAKMYERLLRKQNRFTWNPLRWIKGKFHSYDWNLPPIHETPFRQMDIDEALFTDAHKYEMGVESPAQHLAAQAKLTFEVSTKLTHSHIRPERLNDEDAEYSVILGHRIIDNLRHMKTGEDAKIKNDITLKNLDLKNGELITELAMVYDKIIADIAARDPSVLTDNPIFSDAQIAIGKLGYLGLQKAIEAAPQENDRELHQQLLSQAQKVPSLYKEVRPNHEKALISQIEQALLAATQYREMKQIHKKEQQQKPEGVKLSKEATQKVHQSLETMHRKISHTSAQIAAATEWAVPAANEINERAFKQREATREKTTTLQESGTSRY